MTYTPAVTRGRFIPACEVNPLRRRDIYVEHAQPSAAGMACTWYTNAIPSCEGGEPLPEGATSATVTAGKTLIVDACATAEPIPDPWVGPVATCGEAGFWAATDVVGAHTVPAGATKTIVNEVVPTLLQTPEERGGRSGTGGGSATALTLNVCVPSTTPFVYISNLVPPALHALGVVGGRAGTIKSDLASDTTIIAAMSNFKGNATVLFRPGGPQTSPPGEVTLYWAGNQNSIKLPNLSVMMPALSSQARWTTNNATGVWYMTFNEAADATVGAAANAVSAFLTAIASSSNATLMGQSLAVVWPPPPPTPSSAAELVAKQVLPFINVIVAACAVTGTIVGILTYCINRRKSAPTPPPPKKKVPDTPQPPPPAKSLAI